MKPSRHSVRFRLVIWYSSVLALILCIFSAALFILLKDNLFRQMNMQIDNEIEKILVVARSEPAEIDEIEEIGEYGATGMMLLMKGNDTLFISRAWSKEGFPHRFQQTQGRFYTVRSEKGAHGTG